MLESISVKNIGCFDDYDYKIDFNKLNVIVGTNNSGKSTIFKALNLCIHAFDKYEKNRKAHQIINTNDSLWNNRFYQLINYKQSVYNHNEEKPINVKIKFKSETTSINLECSSNNVFHLDGIISKNNKLHISDRNVPTHKFKKCLYLSPNHDSIEPNNELTYDNKFQIIDPHGFDINSFLLKKWTDQDKNWDSFQEWMKQIDPSISLLKTPIENTRVSLVTQRNDDKNTTEVNFTLQGDGIQYAVTIMAAILFSDEGSTIIIEEPETHLHNRSIEVLVDLFNHAVNKLNKQIIIVTHSSDLLSMYCRDIGKDTERSNQHEIAKQDDFKLIVLRDVLGKDKIQDYSLIDKGFLEATIDFKKLLG